jgi:hypothetical protein
MKMNNEDFYVGINRILAGSKLSEKAITDLDNDVSEDVRRAIEALIVEGEILERDGRYFPKGYKFNDEATL